MPFSIIRKKLKKKSSSKKSIMVFGTFDILHKGHESFFKQAKRYAKILVVSVARDVNVKKIKGNKPFYPEKTRLNNIKKLKIVNQALLGDKGNYLKHIKKINPDIIALGYDQRAYTKTLKSDLKKVGLETKIIRLKAFRPLELKSSKLKRKML